jgi:ribosomal protein L7Ae-like RNA K-turn-binding protein
MEVDQAKELTKEVAIKEIIQTALNVNGVLKGVSETLKALENGRVLLIFLAEDCDNAQYKETLKALANEQKVKVIEVESWEFLKDCCKLGLPSEKIRQIAEDKGKEAKIKPRCSSAAIVDFGSDNSSLKDYLFSL